MINWNLAIKLTFTIFIITFILDWPTTIVSHPYIIHNAKTQCEGEGVYRLQRSNASTVMTSCVSINSLDTRIGSSLLSSVRLPTGCSGWIEKQDRKSQFWHENVHTTLFGYTAMRLNPIYRRSLFHSDTYEA